MDIPAFTARHLGQLSSTPGYYTPYGMNKHFYIFICLGDSSLGFLLGERSGQLTRFACRADALRFCAGRNEAEKQRVATLDARRDPLEARRSTLKTQRSMAAGEEVA